MLRWLVLRRLRRRGGGGRPAAEIVNRGGAMMLIKGWTINAGDIGQNYTFTEGGYLGPGMPVRVYTSNQQQPPGWYDLTFNSNRPIWNDEGDIAELRDSSGNLRARYAYGNATA